MNDKFHLDMTEATRLTRAGRLAEATALLQALHRSGTAPSVTSGTSGAPAGRLSSVIDLVPQTIETADFQPFSPTGQTFDADAGDGPAGRTAQPPMPEALRSFLDRVGRLGPELGNGLIKPCPAHAPDPVPDGARFLEGSYSNQAGSRAYKLYVPSGYQGQAVPLVVMLHGCTQSPDDFAAGTRMNTLAEEHVCLVLYPAQAGSANAQKCWNWFSPGDQQRGQGEPSLIAGITRQIMRDYKVDPQRVYVAGLSAGGAAAAIMGTAYPDLYAAVGVHSGLACGAASDLPSAFAAMRQGEPAAMRRSGNASVPTIVFHGDRDTTVNPRNGDQVVAQAKATTAMNLQTSVQHGQVVGGHAYSRTLHANETGQTILEQWVIHGAGHAWSGGSPAGSYTDPRGPDASREMLRFFLEHSHSLAAGRGASQS
ncbi:MAG: PHB depolymerase family esterase [Pseudomonadota bacterium]|nr:PHB depolymerase family esterase [Pseudomonadota bacterium]